MEMARGCTDAENQSRGIDNTNVGCNRLTPDRTSTSNRVGIAAEKIQVPDDIDRDNKEIETMFVDACTHLTECVNTDSGAM
ncbi:hypothetical protein D5272_14995 [bacterium D16-76]|nr:hypothetical protein [bacterium D16-76]